MSDNLWHGRSQWEKATDSQKELSARRHWTAVRDTWMIHVGCPVVWITVMTSPSEWRFLGSTQQKSIVQGIQD